MIFAQSIGPLDLWGRFAVRRFCKGLNRATVRDERSRELLADLVPGTPVEHQQIYIFLYDAPSRSISRPKGWTPAVRRTRS